MTFSSEAAMLDAGQVYVSSEPRPDQGSWAQPPIAAYVVQVAGEGFHGVGPRYISSACPSIAEDFDPILAAELEAWALARDEDMAKLDRLIDELE